MSSWAGIAPYCTAANLKPYIDKRYLARLLSDTGKPIATDPWLDTEVLPFLIDSISGEVEAALFVGCKYTSEQVENMESNGKAFLYRLLAGLLMSALYDRRGMLGDNEQENRTRETVWARKQLDKMRAGTRILPIPEVAEARAGSTVRDESQTARNNRKAYTYRFRRVMGER